MAVLHEWPSGAVPGSSAFQFLVSTAVSHRNRVGGVVSALATGTARPMRAAVLHGPAGTLACIQEVAGPWTSAR